MGRRCTNINEHWGRRYTSDTTQASKNKVRKSHWALMSACHFFFCCCFWFSGVTWDICNAGLLPLIGCDTLVSGGSLSGTAHWSRRVRALHKDRRCANSRGHSGTLVRCSRSGVFFCVVFFLPWRPCARSAARLRRREAPARERSALRLSAPPGSQHPVPSPALRSASLAPDLCRVSQTSVHQCFLLLLHLGRWMPVVGRHAAHSDRFKEPESDFTCTPCFD